MAVGRTRVRTRGSGSEFGSGSDPDPEMGVGSEIFGTKSGPGPAGPDPDLFGALAHHLLGGAY
jgi:hypothetical protein